VAVRNKASADPMERIARVLAIIAVKGMDNEQAARRLLAAGFDANQIGGLLDVNPNFARVAKLRGKRKAKARR
jgi:hypothetical protein